MPAVLAGKHMTSTDAAPQPALDHGVHAPTPAPRPAATAALVGVNVLVFVAMIVSGVSPLRPLSDQLLRWGANYGPLTADGQWWRLFTYMFIHIGVAHLVLNMWALWNLGELGENLYGRWKLLGIYLLSGVAGGIASIARNPAMVIVAPSAGASGAIFGLAGALIATFKLGHLPLPPSVMRSTLRSLIAAAGYSLLFGFISAHIDNGAHLGGLICGLVLGAVLSRDFRAGAHARRATALYLFAAAALLLAGSAAWVRHARAPVMHMMLAEKALRNGDAQSAIRDLQAAIRLRPDYARAHQRLGDVYLVSKRLPEAEAEYRQALALDNANLDARKTLAVLYAQTNRIAPAIELLSQAAQASPNDAAVFYELGALLHQAGRDSEAIPALEKATVLQPRFAPAHYALGAAHLALKQYDAAIAAFRASAQLAPAVPDSYISLANAYEAKGMKKEANEAYARAYELRRKNPSR